MKTQQMHNRTMLLACGFASLGVSAAAMAQTIHVTTNGSFDPAGTAQKPYGLVAAGACATTAQGVLSLGQGTYAESVSIAYPMIVTATGGTARIGDLGAESTTFKVATFNTHLFGDAIPNLPSPLPPVPWGVQWLDSERAMRIGDAAAIEDADCFAMQEVWDPHKYGLVRGHAGYPYAFYGSRSDPETWNGVPITDTLNSGLALFSKHVLADQEQVSYSAENGFVESLASKGYLVSTIEKDGFTIGVFNTHLQAHEGSMNVVARMAQLSQLATAIASYQAAHPSSPVIVLGDFNVKGESTEYTGTMAPRMGSIAGTRDVARNAPCFVAGPPHYTSFQLNPLNVYFTDCVDPEHSLCVQSCAPVGETCDTLCGATVDTCVALCETARDACLGVCHSTVCCFGLCDDSDVCNDCEDACDSTFSSCDTDCRLECQDCQACENECDATYCEPPDVNGDARLDYILYAPSLNGTVDIVPEAYALRNYRGPTPLSYGGLTTTELSDHVGVMAEFRLIRR